jgi:hypothetical protein
MYVFTSAVFFLLFVSFFSSKEKIGRNDMYKPLDVQQRAAYINTLQDRIKKDSNNAKLLSTLAWAKDTTKVITARDILEAEGRGIKINFGDTNYKNDKEYDSLQKTLPARQRDGWFRRRLIKKEIEISEKYRENPEEAAKKLVESILHRLPYMLFVSLPLFALILKLVYIRKKQFYYADHGVFTIHLYIFTFLLLLVVFGLSSLQDATNWGFITFLMVILFIALFFYLYKAMRNFYGQRRAKTFIKFLIVALFSLLMMAILFVSFMFFSAITL